MKFGFNSPTGQVFFILNQNEHSNKMNNLLYNTRANEFRLFKCKQIQELGLLLESIVSGASTRGGTQRGSPPLKKRVQRSRQNGEEYVFKSFHFEQRQRQRFSMSVHFKSHKPLEIGQKSWTPEIFDGYQQLRKRQTNCYRGNPLDMTILFVE